MAVIDALSHGPSNFSMLKGRSRVIVDIFFLKAHSSSSNKGHLITTGSTFSHELSSMSYEALNVSPPGKGRFETSNDCVNRRKPLFNFFFSGNACARVTASASKRMVSGRRIFRKRPERLLHRKIAICIRDGATKIFLKMAALCRKGVRGHYAL